PDSSVCDFDMAENIRLRILVELALRGFVSVRGESCDEDECRDPAVGPRGGDHTATVTVPDQNRRTAHPPERVLHGGDIAGESIETVLSRDHLVTFRLKSRDHLAEARTIGPDPVAEDDAGLLFRGLHVRSPCVWSCGSW